MKTTFLWRAAHDAGVPIRTAERWLARYRQIGLAGLARPVRSVAAAHRLPAALVALIEGMGLKKPRSSAAAIHRRISKIAQAQSWRVPSYSTVYAILANLDPTIVTLSHEGAAAFRDRFELIHRHRTGAANAIWQKADPSWPVCGIPDGLYVDQGGDFTSNHLDQVAASLRFRIVYSTVARPQGRGKIERLFGTLNSELLPELAGHHADLQDPAAPRVGLPH